MSHSSRAVAVLASLLMASPALGARGKTASREPDAQPVWEQPGGRERARMDLATALLEQPGLMPRWLLHRMLRDRKHGDNPLDEN